MKTYFKTLWFWPVDVILCYVVASLITPADPYSAMLVFVGLTTLWMIIRRVIARRLSQS
jgi:Sec-independent protein secretion pathway component TatC